MKNSNPNYPTRIFISYASEDEECAQILKTFFSGFQATGVFAASNIMSGKPFFDTITNALKSSDCIIALISRDSIDIPWIAFEVGAFVGREKSVILLSLESFPLEKFRTPLKNLQIRSSDPETLKEIITSLHIILHNDQYLDNIVNDTVTKLNRAQYKKRQQNKLSLKFSESIPDIHENVPTMRHIDVTNNHDFRWADRCRAYMTYALLDNQQARLNWEKLKRCLLKWEHRKEYFIEIPSGDVRTLDAFTYKSSDDNARHIIGRNSSIDVFAQEMHIEVPKKETHAIRFEYIIVDDDFGSSRCWIEIHLEPNKIPVVRFGTVSDLI